MTGLRGRTVVVTRAPHQAAPLDALLRQYGAEPLSYPCIDIAPPEDTAELDDALRSAAAGGFDWLLLTSANTVIALERQLKMLGLPPDTLAKLKVGAVGPVTAHEAETRLSVQVDVIPEDFVGDALTQAITDSVRDSDEESARPPVRLLLPHSDIADPKLTTQSWWWGIKVIGVPAYRTVIGSGGIDLPDLLAQGKIDAITFTSGSTVVNCFARLKNNDLLADVTVACIGSKTADVARNFGMTNCIVPTEHTLDAMVAALDAHFSTLETGDSPS